MCLLPPSLIRELPSLALPLGVPFPKLGDHFNNGDNNNNDDNDNDNNFQPICHSDIETTAPESTWSP